MTPVPAPVIVFGSKPFINFNFVRPLVGLLIASLACLLPAPAVWAAAVKAYESSLVLPTYPWLPAVRHPYFKETDGKNIYPYPMLDNLSRTPGSRTWRTVVLENEYLCVTFLPDLGGKIYSVLNKPTGKQVFYVNHAVKPGLIGQCGAWVSGGIEFNTGPQGHTVSAVMPVDVAILPASADGSRSVVVGEVEKIYRTRWTVKVTLRPGRSFLEESIRIYNPTEIIRPYYFWNCTAMPNTDGFRFVYPMTLGSDHDARQFFSWPMDKGKDLSLARNYQDAASIFAYQCDQDFFGSYDEQADTGVVAYANHHEVPGKKAWTWGRGGFGAMHQMDLTDQDGPYNEVQTGPLPTQADVGRLEPGEAVQWQEWWYPVHGIGGFTFANRDVAVQVAREGPQIHLRILGTGSWKKAEIRSLQNNREMDTAVCPISPREPARVSLAGGETTQPVAIQIRAKGETLANFSFPLPLPKRTQPTRREEPQTAWDHAQAGWQHFLFARFSEAETSFNTALERDAKLSSAQAGLAFLQLNRDPAAAMSAAQKAVRSSPDEGLARFALAVAEWRQDQGKDALADAWKAALDPITATGARALAGKILLRQKDWEGAVQALSPAGPWQADPLVRNRLAFAYWKLGRQAQASQLARENLAVDALDAFARSLLWLARAETQSLTLRHLILDQAQSVLELVVEYAELGQEETALSLLREFYSQTTPHNRHPIPFYWVAWLEHRLQHEDMARQYLRIAGNMPAEGVFPHRPETVTVLRWALATAPEDGHAALYLGHLLFYLGRQREGREYWKRAGELGVEPAIAYRALGQASRLIDRDLDSAIGWLTRAHQADLADPIVARDLAQALFASADKGVSEDRQQALVVQAGQVLNAAFAAGKIRSDFVTLLARSNNRLGNYAQTAQLLDTVRITIWEGAREVHDLFEEAHLSLGQAQLKAGRPTPALAEFNRALEYPENLATGKLENTCESHIHFLRGQALAALGQKTAALEAWKKAVNQPASKDTKKENARQKAQDALATMLTK